MQFNTFEYKLPGNVIIAFQWTGTISSWNYAICVAMLQMVYFYST